jgi:hypothetical protein
MRWTRQRRALYVLANDAAAYGKAVWFWHPDAGVKFAQMRTTVAKKPGHREEHGISRKTIAQGVPGVPVSLW